MWLRIGHLVLEVYIEVQKYYSLQNMLLNLLAKRQKCVWNPIFFPGKKSWMFLVKHPMGRFRLCLLIEPPEGMQIRQVLAYHFHSVPLIDQSPM